MDVDEPDKLQKIYCACLKSCRRMAELEQRTSSISLRHSTPVQIRIVRVCLRKIQDPSQLAQAKPVIK